MANQIDEAQAFQDALQKLQQARTGRSDSSSVRLAFELRRQQLQQTLAEAEKAREAADQVGRDAKRVQAYTPQHTRAREVALKRLREIEARVLPELAAMEDPGFQLDRNIVQVNAEAAKWERQARSHLKTMQENLQAVQETFDAAVEEAATIDSWLPMYDTGRRGAQARYVSANRSRIEFSADYQRDIYHLEIAETTKEMLLAIVSATAATKAALAKSLEGSFTAIGTQVGKETVKALLQNAALRAELVKTAATRRELLKAIFDQTWLPVSKRLVKSLLKDEQKPYFFSSENAHAYLDDLQAFSPTDIDLLASGPVRRDFDRMPR